jgi:hypothetical protein
LPPSGDTKTLEVVVVLNVTEGVVPTALAEKVNSPTCEGVTVHEKV